MDAAAALKPSKKRTRLWSILNKPHLPTDVIEEILLNLPLKSLVRFSTVSKSWRSMISNPVFARKHKNRAALLCRHRLVVYVNSSEYKAASFCSLAPISADLSLKVVVKPNYSTDGNGRRSVPFFSVFSATNIDLRDFVGQFGGNPYLLAYCDEFWCVQVDSTLFLWNPSMRNIVELPVTNRLNSLYGLAYDSVNDDYKILKIMRYPSSTTELYSLKNNCWRKIKPFSSSDVRPYPSRKQQRCEFVDGKLHWVGITAAGARIIVSFDLSTEKYGEVAQPLYDAELNRHKYYLEVVALRGMLCVSQTYTQKARFVLWVMEEYGVEKSWTKRFDIPFSPHLRNLTITPFYLSDDSNVVILVKSYRCSKDHSYIFMYTNGEAKPKKIVTCGGGDKISLQPHAFLYVESLITHENFSRNCSSHEIV